MPESEKREPAEGSVDSFFRLIDRDEKARAGLIAGLAGELRRDPAFTSNLSREIAPNFASDDRVNDLVWGHFWSRMKRSFAVAAATLATLVWLVGGKWIEDAAKDAAKTAATAAVEAEQRAARTIVDTLTRTTSTSLAAVQETLGATRAQQEATSKSAQALRSQIEELAQQLQTSRELYDRLEAEMKTAEGSLSGLENARQNLIRLIDETSVRNVFVKLQADHYRLRDVRLEVRYYPTDPVHIANNRRFHFGNISLAKRNTRNIRSSIVEFTQEDGSLGVMNNEGVPEYLEVSYVPFFAFRNRLRESLLDIFDDLRDLSFHIIIRYREGQREEYLSFVSEIREKIKLLSVDLIVNGTPVQIGRFENISCEVSETERDRVVKLHCLVSLDERIESFRRRFDAVSEQWLARYTSR